MISKVELRWGQFCCWLYMLATRSASSINLDEGLVSRFVEKGLLDQILFAMATPPENRCPVYLALF
jgi:hypothetical protein